MNKYYDEAWNPILGCRGNFLGCKNCFSKAMHSKRHDTPFEQVSFNQRAFRKAHLPNTTVLICSQSDPFQEAVGLRQIDAIVKHALNFPSTKFLILTKYAARAREYFNDSQLLCRLSQNFKTYGGFDNIAIGTTVEHSQYLGRLDEILNIAPIAKKFAAFEPVLDDFTEKLPLDDLAKLDFVVLGADKNSPSSISLVQKFSHVLNNANIRVHLT